MDKFPALAAEYSVSAMPTFTFIKNNSTLDTIVGANITQIRVLLSKYSSGSSFGSGGRVLGSGKAAAKPSGLENGVNGNMIMFGILGIFILFLYLTK